MIRQAITCDICASEKKHTNHWFVAHEQGGELRLTGWSSKNRLRPGTKHLCGQICLHKLVDEFMARAVRSQVAMADEAFELSAQSAQASQFVQPAQFVQSQPTVMHEVPPRHTQVIEPPPPVEMEPVARALPEPKIPKPEPKLPKHEPLLPKVVPARIAGELVALPGRITNDDSPVANDGPRYASRNWRADAWDRERERELRAVEHRPTLTPKRRSGS